MVNESASKKEEQLHELPTRASVDPNKEIATGSGKTLPRVEETCCFKRDDAKKGTTTCSGRGFGKGKRDGSRELTSSPDPRLRVYRWTHTTSHRGKKQLLATLDSLAGFNCMQDQCDEGNTFDYWRPPFCIHFERCNGSVLVAQHVWHMRTVPMPIQRRSR